MQSSHSKILSNLSRNFREFKEDCKELKESVVEMRSGGDIEVISNDEDEYTKYDRQISSEFGMNVVRSAEAKELEQLGIGIQKN